ncbi:hypothetical protein AB0K23_21025 [Streptomyces sp. NPDC049602]|uniref:hypothetical protein n=1 Tax=Streptomyces sp. NPDC049602 TaxID=3155504 RepID=UPI003445B9F7
MWPRTAHDEGFARAWVEDVLRRELPVASWRRVTARPLELCGGAELPAGAELMLMLMLMGSGSDPDVFTPLGRWSPAARTAATTSPSAWGATAARARPARTRCGGGAHARSAVLPHSAAGPRRRAVTAGVITEAER